MHSLTAKSKLLKTLSVQTTHLTIMGNVFALCEALKDSKLYFFVDLYALLHMNIYIYCANEFV